MPVFLKDIKKELEKDKNKVGKKPNGDLKHKPPTIISRKLADYPVLDIQKLTVHANPKQETLKFKGVIQSETSSTWYKVTLEFHDVSFREEENSRHTDKIMVEDDKYFYSPPSASRNPVRMRCQCEDWRHRFEHPMKEVDALVGARRSYTRKTPPWPQGYPYANSTEKLGMCKHLYTFLYVLYAQKFLKER
jgi:hypothetical protein